MKSHPDRRGATLLQCAEEAACSGGGPFAAPGAGSADARMDLKLMRFRAELAMEHDERARQRLSGFDRAARPDLWAGTVQDGTARGFLAVLEEAASLLPADPRGGDPESVLQRFSFDPLADQEFTGKDLRRKKDMLIAAAGPRVRFSRKEGLLLVDRERDLASPGFLKFEDRSDRGTLDEFVPDAGERPRIFDARFLKPVRYRQGPVLTALLLEGRLGRGPQGFPCRLSVLGFADEPFLRLWICVDNRVPDHRLRARFLGLPEGYVWHRCTGVGERVENSAGGFHAVTIVRGCGRLSVDGVATAMPGAQTLGPIEHEFRIGGTATAR